MKFPANSLLAGNFGLRDEFAHDCLLQRRVCKLSVPLLSSEPGGGLRMRTKPFSTIAVCACRRMILPVGSSFLHLRAFMACKVRRRR